MHQIWPQTANSPETHPITFLKQYGRGQTSFFVNSDVAGAVKYHFGGKKENYG